jgi:predicted ATPase/DNA-binding CsgD family transcriptional regulator
VASNSIGKATSQNLRNGAELSLLDSPWQSSEPAALPRPLTSFIGREAACAEVVDLLTQPHIRLLNLTGPAGVGKTRLAMQAAAIAGHTFRDSVRFISLAAVTDPDRVPLAMVQALRLQEMSDEPDAARVVEYFAARRILVVLDNVEQVLAAGPFFANLLRAAPELKLMVTSRAQLRLTGEHVLVVPPLSLPEAGEDGQPQTRQDSQPEAVQLFIARAVAVNSAFSPKPGDWEVIGEICRQLDGLPLAIELAAARCSHFTPRGMLSRLTNRLNLLTGGARDQPERLRSLRAAIGWSYDLLTPVEQSLFRQLTVFVGGFTLAGAEAVVDLDGGASSNEILDGVSALIDNSLVRWDTIAGGEQRYRLLQTIRDYGCELLERHGELTEVKNRHAAHYADLAAETSAMLTDMTEVERLLRVDADYLNFVAAMEWMRLGGDTDLLLQTAGDLGWYWYYRGLIQEGRQWLESATEIGGSHAGARERAVASIGLAIMRQVGGDIASAIELFGEAKRLATLAGDHRSEGIATNLLAGALVTAEDYEGALPLFEESMTLWRAGEHDAWLGHAQFHLGLIAFAQQDADVANHHLSESVRLYTGAGASLDAADPLLYLGFNACQRGDLDAARRHFGDALDQIEDRQSVGDLAMGIVGIACFADAQDHGQTAAMLLGSAKTLRSSTGSPFPKHVATACDRVSERLLARLGTERWEAACQAGTNLSASEATALAKSELAADGDRVASGQRPPRPANPWGLTSREYDVLQLIAQGMTNDEIAEVLFISAGTARTHVSNILAKLEVRSRTEAVSLAHRHRLV